MVLLQSLLLSTCPAAAWTLHGRWLDRWLPPRGSTAVRSMRHMPVRKAQAAVRHHSYSYGYRTKMLPFLCRYTVRDASGSYSFSRRPRWWRCRRGLSHWRRLRRVRRCMTRSHSRSLGRETVKKQYKAPICESEDRGLCGERPPKGESLAIGAQRS